MNGSRITVAVGSDFKGGDILTIGNGDHPVTVVSRATDTCLWTEPLFAPLLWDRAASRLGRWRWRLGLRFWWLIPPWL